MEQCLHAAPRVVRDPDLLKALVGVHVLIVDHDPDARELLESALTYGGAFVTLTATAAEGLAYLLREPVDVVIAGVLLPDNDGYWLVREIGDRAPVIALATAQDDGPERTLAAGFRAHLRKPVDPWELCRIVGRLARRP
jgi:CheY-like chemotaxis protein